MVTKIKSYLGIKPLPEVSLEVQVKSTTFKSTYPDPEDSLSYNEWTVYLRNQLYGRKKRKKTKKVATFYKSS